MAKLRIFHLTTLYFTPISAYKPSTYAPSNYVGSKTDPRFARSTEELLCLGNPTDRVIESGMLNVDDFREENDYGRSDKPNFSGNKKTEGTVGCCPNTETGKPFGPGKSCCFGRIFKDDDSHFCCESLGKVLTNDYDSWKVCEQAGVNTCSPLDIPNPMIADCTDNFNQGSNCSFSCPSGLRIRQPDDPSFYCDGEGEWQGEKPDCCLTDGCPKNLKVDFYFIIDSSSSIGKHNFQYVREYIVQLVSSLPIGQNNVRVGLITYNKFVNELITFDQFDDKESLIDYVLKMPYNGRGTFTNKAITFATEQGMVEEKGDRPDVPNFIIVLTDGKAKDDVSIGSPGLQAKGMVVAIGVGDKIKQKDLVTISGNPDNVYLVSDFRSLNPTSVGGRGKGGRGKGGSSGMLKPHMRLSSNKLCPTRCAVGDYDY